MLLPLLLLHSGNSLRSTFTASGRARPLWLAVQRQATVLIGEEGEGTGEYGMTEMAHNDALQILQAVNLTVELSLTLCDNAFMRALNAQWRGKDSSTDVLSFPVEDEVMVGDVVICLSVAERQAAERGHSLRDEVRVLLVHGLLHLMGYDHEVSLEAALEMEAAEQLLLTRLQWANNGLISSSGQCHAVD
uniref:Uncharacterized protein n=1 Tax=Calcidiscus leptoporus TaxID=127549 RepID=A0A7S0P0T7_9EUKA|mmetsp:Transcript_46846/g.108823  ORF Transcript_46846/g.108823 Transcript_46846/m.108823 type:complete len:190 (+) Transcript_46846:45-614(+)